jgi:hypothetical protein
MASAAAINWWASTQHSPPAFWSLAAGGKAALKRIVRIDEPGVPVDRAPERFRERSIIIAAAALSCLGAMTLAAPSTAAAQGY